MTTDAVWSVFIMTSRPLGVKCGVSCLMIEFIVCLESHEGKTYHLPWEKNSGWRGQDKPWCLCRTVGLPMCTCSILIHMLNRETEQASSMHVSHCYFQFCHRVHTSRVFFHGGSVNVPQTTARATAKSWSQQWKWRRHLPLCFCFWKNVTKVCQSVQSLRHSESVFVWCAVLLAMVCWGCGSSNRGRC